MSRTRMHPFTALALTALVITNTTALGQWSVSCAVIVLALIVAVIRHCVGKVLTLSAAIVVPLAVSLFMIHGLATHEGHVVAKFWFFTLTNHGLETMGLLLARTAVLVVVGMLALISIDRHQLIAAIDLTKVPPQIGYLVAATLGLLPQLQARQQAISQAQALRLGTGRGVRATLRSIRLQAVPLVLSSLQEGSAKAPHLAARGFGSSGPMTRLREVPDSLSQKGIRYIALALSILGPIIILVLRWKVGS